MYVQPQISKVRPWYRIVTKVLQLIPHYIRIILLYEPIKITHISICTYLHINAPKTLDFNYTKVASYSLWASSSSASHPSQDINLLIETTTGGRKYICMYINTWFSIVSEEEYRPPWKIKFSHVLLYILFVCKRFLTAPLLLLLMGIYKRIASKNVNLYSDIRLHFIEDNIK